MLVYIFTMPKLRQLCLEFCPGCALSYNGPRFMGSLLGRAWPAGVMQILGNSAYDLGQNLEKFAFNFI